MFPALVQMPNRLDLSGVIKVVGGEAEKIDFGGHRLGDYGVEIGIAHSGDRFAQAGVHLVQQGEVLLPGPRQIALGGFGAWEPIRAFAWEAASLLASELPAYNIFPVRRMDDQLPDVRVMIGRPPG